VVTTCYVRVAHECVCHPDNDTGNLVTEALSSNGRPLWFRYSDFQAACHIAPCLKLFTSDSLMVYYLFLLSRSVRLFLFRCFFPSRCLLSKYYICSLLVGAGLKQPLDKVLSTRYMKFFFFCQYHWGGGGCVYITGSSSMCSFFFFSEGVDPSTRCRDNMLLTTGDTKFLIAIPSFCW
jgi:hypothetical protein